MTFSADFVATVSKTYEEGEAWLGELPNLHQQVLADWQLTLDGGAFSSRYHLVLPVRDETRSELVLKLGVPCPEAESEAEALRLYQGLGAIQLRREDPGLGARLLDRATPGFPLSQAEIWQHDLVVSESALQLIRPCDPNERLHPLESWLQGLLEADPLSCPVEFELVLLAQKAAVTLLGSTSERVLLHGDLHANNILMSGDEWVAIDPKGLMGDRCFEPAQHFLNSLPPHTDFSSLVNFCHRRLSVISYTTGFPANRILGWALANAVNAIIVDEGDVPPEWFEVTAALGVLVK
ncbi:MAG: aminoglycoside phosphotransferase family protein [Fimbriimonadaceae bacterium]|nr:aminoglycoside phosphotransferase family protein [Fimbriimonadaceae bacterium]